MIEWLPPLLTLTSAGVAVTALIRARSHARTARAIAAAVTSAPLTYGPAWVYLVVNAGDVQMMGQTAHRGQLVAGVYRTSLDARRASERYPHPALVLPGVPIDQDLWITESNGRPNRIHRVTAMDAGGLPKVEPLHAKGTKEG